ncbi:MAG: LbtU family siderophore porin [Candidatus Desulfaltia sp.]|nr:LbtU family siderophore porin [Candidatus Desulfaltia sp.]
MLGKNKINLFVLFSILFCFFFFLPLSSVSAQSELEELKQRIEQLEGKVEKQEKEQKDILGKLSENITITGAIELDYTYKDPSSTTVANSDSTSNLDIGTVQLGVEAKFHEWVTGNFVLKGENLDDGTNDRVFWDEATITIQKEGFPLYFVGGKRGQPFGVFNSHLISDPITKDCYEVAKSGATIGFTPDLLGLDMSATVYKGEVLADKLSGASYGWARDPAPNPDPTDNVDSYVLNVSIAPIEGLNLSTYFDSEPGQGSRNETAGGTIEYQIGIFTFDAEYVAALEREKNAPDNKEYKESAWFGAIACQVIDPLEIALRYEAFDDDKSGNQDGSLENRYSVGANYKLFEKDNFTTTLMLEYRRSNYEKAAGSTVDDTVDEVFARVAIEF